MTRLAHLHMCSFEVCLDIEQLFGIKNMYLVDLKVILLRAPRDGFTVTGFYRTALIHINTLNIKTSQD